KEACRVRNEVWKQSRARTPRICVEEHAYACDTKPNPRLGKSITLRRGNLFILSSHMRRSPRICVGSQQAHVPSHVYTTSNVTFTSPSLTHPHIGVEDPRICVEGTLAASNHTRPTP
ncbi:hypothetical protein PIB30_105702, partial [Stylosanthes scabra]|nr:hypothetical protein [Stylosanthes scabra]